MGYSSINPSNSETVSICRQTRVAQHYIRDNGDVVIRAVTGRPGNQPRSGSGQPDARHDHDVGRFTYIGGLGSGGRDSAVKVAGICDLRVKIIDVEGIDSVSQH